MANRICFVELAAMQQELISDNHAAIPSNSAKFCGDRVS
jgi:hypothetical protein